METNMDTLIDLGNMPTLKLRDNAYVLGMSESNEWYTPSIYVEAARRVMHGIELDPASNPFANQVVKAQRYYTKESDGFSQDWTCKSLWLNPPYGKKDSQTGNVSLWINRLIEEYKTGNVHEAILLVNALPDRRWFDPLWSFLICFVRTRISFYNALFPKGDTRPPHGNAIVYLGPNEQTFINEFSAFGTIVKRVDTPKPKPIMLDLWQTAAS